MKYFYILLFLSFSLFTQAQITINGRVVNNKNKPIVGANITLVDTYDGTTTDSTGNFSFTTTEKGKQRILISNDNYKPIYIAINLDSVSGAVNVTLKDKVTEMKAAVVTAGTFEASDKKKGTVLTALDIVTTAGSNGDNFSALKTLPGTQQTNDREGLFVRGGTGYETQTFIDGTLVRNAFLTGVPDLGARGRFNPFLFKGTTFSTGGYSALYGQALSSAVILETEDMPDKSQGFANFSSVGIGAGILKVNKEKTQSYSVSLNHTNLGPYFYLIKQNVTYNQAPVYNQLDLSYRKKIGKSGLLKFYGYINTGRLDITRSDIDSYDYLTNSFKYNTGFKLHNNNTYANVSYKTDLSRKWKLQSRFCYSYNNDDISLYSVTLDNQPNTDTSIAYKFKNNHFVGNNQIATGKVVLQRSIGGLNKLRFGTEYIHYFDKQELKNYNTTYSIQDNYIATFAETDVYITNEIAGKVGIRSENNSIIGTWNVAPRVSLAYKVHPKGQISLAYGQFYQKPENRYLFMNTGLGYMKATHYIANYLYQTKDYLLRVEGYYKKYDDLIKTPFTINTFSPIAANNNGTGYAKGFEVFFRDKKTLPGIDYWISYSYIDTKRDFMNYLRLTQPDFVSTHVASLVFKKFWVKKMFGLNGTYTYASGRPYINYNTTNPYNTTANPDLFMSDKTQPYHNFSLSCNYLKSIKKTFNVFVLSVNNPLYLKQVYGYNYSLYATNADGSLYSKPITPAARTFVFLGWFMSWGVDKTDDAINNNL